MRTASMSTHAFFSLSMVVLSCTAGVDIAELMREAEAAQQSVSTGSDASQEAADAAWRAVIEAGGALDGVDVLAAVDKARRRLGINLSLGGLKLAGGLGVKHGEGTRRAFPESNDSNSNRQTRASSTLLQSTSLLYSTVWYDIMGCDYNRERVVGL